jgi:hypothetical protein
MNLGKILMSKFLLISLCKFPKPWYIQKSNFIQKRILPVTFGPPGLSAQSFFLPADFPSPPPLGLGLPVGPAHPHGPIGHLLPPPAPTSGAHGAVVDRPRAASTVAPTPPPEEKKMAASIPIISPLLDAISPLQ